MRFNGLAKGFFIFILALVIGSVAQALTFIIIMKPVNPDEMIEFEEKEEEEVLESI